VTALPYLVGLALFFTFVALVFRYLEVEGRIAWAIAAVGWAAAVALVVVGALERAWIALALGVVALAVHGALAWRTRGASAGAVGSKDDD
jgi:hypothetical protein